MQQATMILNPRAGGGRHAAAIRRWATEQDNLRLCETSSDAEAQAMAAAACEAGDQMIIAAGGDGAIHHVVQGVMSCEHQPTLGVIPAGTANDFSSVLGLAGSPRRGMRAIERGRTEVFDLIRIQDEHGPPRHLINAATGGVSVAIRDAMNREVKSWWGALAYARTALEVIPIADTFSVHVQGDGVDVTADAIALVVANGPRAGGYELLPGSDARDGLLDVGLATSVSILDRAALFAEFAMGGQMESERVSHFRSSWLTVHSEPEMSFLVDGERDGTTPIRFEVTPSAIRVVTAADENG